MIEAFRLGIVPYDCVHSFTFGREEEEKEARAWLDSSTRKPLIVVGGYGAGKTHFLQWTSEHALEAGFAVAKVEIDPNEAPFHKPKRVYSRLIQSLRYYSTETGEVRRLSFRDFLRESLSTGQFKEHFLFNKVMNGRDDEAIWDWIEARESIIRPYDPSLENKYSELPALYDFSTTANIYCYLLSTLGWAAKELLGLKGLVLIFDEAEIVTTNFYNYQEERGFNFLKSLVRTASDDETLLGPPEYSGLQYCTKGYATRTPFLYRAPSGLRLVLAFTPIDALDYDYLHTRSRTVLRPLPELALRSIFDRIVETYRGAYGFPDQRVDLTGILERAFVQRAHTRMFVKSLVEGLDLRRLT